MLAHSPCRTLCDWRPVDGDLHRCSGCGTEWLPTERWTPRQADGTVPSAVRDAQRDAVRDAQRDA